MPWFEVQLTVTGSTNMATALTSAPVVLPRGVIEEWYVTPTNNQAANIWFYLTLDEQFAFPRAKAPNMIFTWLSPLGDHWGDHTEILEKSVNMKLVAYNLAETDYTVIAGVFVNVAKLKELERRVGYESMPTKVQVIPPPQPT